MIRWIFGIVILLTYGFTHPVSYTINLTATYDKDSKEIKISCISSSRNKCGLHSFHILDKEDNIITTKRFPFLKKAIIFKSEIEPNKMIFFLRKVPEHQYNVFFERD